MDKGKIEAMVTKFSEKSPISMLKKHRKFRRRGLIHLDATHIFKKSSDTYETACIWFQFVSKQLEFGDHPVTSSSRNLVD